MRHDDSDFIIYSTVQDNDDGPDEFGRRGRRWYALSDNVSTLLASFNTSAGVSLSLFVAISYPLSLSHSFRGTVVCVRARHTIIYTTSTSTYVNYVGVLVLRWQREAARPRPILPKTFLE